MAGLLAFAAGRRPQKTVAAVQFAAFATSMAVVAIDHYWLMRRATELTGQTFGGFP
jgi:hypothetical protein